MAHDHAVAVFIILPVQGEACEYEYFTKIQPIEKFASSQA
jgi:hypothetical protein